MHWLWLIVPNGLEDFFKAIGRGYPDGFEFEWTATPNESWGVPIVEAVIPMLAKVGVRVKIKPIEGSALGGTVQKGDFQAYIWSNTSGPG